LTFDFILFLDSWLSETLKAIMRKKHKKTPDEIKAWVGYYRRHILKEEASQNTEESVESQLYWKRFIDQSEYIQMHSITILFFSAAYIFLNLPFEGC
jgi:hypothetical protein